ncbi:substrate-binding domain-containing protein [Conexibacter woesei]|uniref:substrate-binding domain-containing protein n=1 Tax=Conexibacter woesei TaxID=191495 RepID=UPI0003F4B564|nr:substrate-binding domain-containing protein [Conexibacter woesei]
MRRWALLMMLVAALAAGCGSKTVVTEGPVTVAGSGATVPGGAEAGSPDMPGGARAVRIAVVTHGQAASPFWAIVRNGVDAAGRQVGAVISYRAPDVYSLEHMERLIDQAVATRPDGLVVSLPEPGLAPAIKRAVRAGIPTVTINSGSDMYKQLGVLAHVGQPEGDAGFKAGRRLAALGARRPLCINLAIDNQGLDERCRGLARAMRAAGGRSTVVRIDDQDPGAPQAIATAVRKEHADAVLAMNSTSGVAAAKALPRSSRVTVATFDLGPDVLRAVKAGRIAFAVDQQAYLQGYLPVVLLTERARYGLFPAQGDVIPTGPNFVTPANAAKAIALSARSIR